MSLAKKLGFFAGLFFAGLIMAAVEQSMVMKDVVGSTNIIGAEAAGVDRELQTNIACAYALFVSATSLKTQVSRFAM